MRRRRQRVARLGNTQATDPRANLKSDLMVNAVSVQPQIRAPVLQMRGITKIYRMGEVEVHALRLVDLQLFSGEYSAHPAAASRPY